MIRTLLIAAVSILLVACGDSSPGPLAGTWKSVGGFALKTTFREGETVSLGLIEKVGYQVDGNSVRVTYKSGLMKGTSVRYELSAPNTYENMGMTFKKVGG